MGRVCEDPWEEGPNPRPVPEGKIKQNEGGNVNQVRGETSRKVACGSRKAVQEARQRHLLSSGEGFCAASKHGGGDQGKVSVHMQREIKPEVSPNRSFPKALLG
ncbi:uncharacterized protein LOC144577845 [Callithrix jacchus]